MFTAREMLTIGLQLTALGFLLDAAIFAVLIPLDWWLHERRWRRAPSDYAQDRATDN